ncbi:MAG: GDSL-type esterase/lipase family protein [Phycisphaeraceae bacterium]|nr:GDSL-type esterase/lipase family protein [Phycisphaeraceae bacterium]
MFRRFKHLGIHPGNEPQAVSVRKTDRRHCAEAAGAGLACDRRGQNGRTTVFEDPIEPYKNGKAALPILLETHRPLDVVTIMLGTNDLKHFFNLGPRDIALGAATLAEMVMASGAGPDGTGPKVLLISPPRVTAEHFAPKFDEAIPKSQGFAEAYRMMADQIGCAFLDAAPLCDAPVPDGVHLDEASIVKLGEAMAEKIAAI